MMLIGTDNWKNKIGHICTKIKNSSSNFGKPHNRQGHKIAEIGQLFC